MTAALQAAPRDPGLYIPNGSMAEATIGLLTSGDLLEDPAHPEYAVFSAYDPAVPQLRYLPGQGNGRPGPRVEVVVVGFPYPVANLWRITDGERVRVRGGVQRPTSGGFVVVDSEVPFGRPVTYQAGVEFEDESAIYTQPATITLDAALMGADWGKAFVHNVLEPSRSMECIFAGDALGELTAGSAGASFVPEGARKAMWMGSTQTGLVGVNLSASTYTLDDARIFSEMFGTPMVPKLPILVFRGPPELLIPGTFVAVVPEHTAVPHNVASRLSEWVEWRMVGDEVEPPFPGLAEPVVTWEDVAVRFPGPNGADDYGAAYATFLDMERDYSLVGLADN